MRELNLRITPLALVFFQLRVGERPCDLRMFEVSLIQGREVWCLVSFQNGTLVAPALGKKLEILVTRRLCDICLICTFV